MRTVSYGGESFVTSDAAAAALLDFAAAAALSDFAAVVHVPAVDSTGAPITADLVIGPASEVFVTPVTSAFDEPDTVDAVADLKRQTSELAVSRHVSTAAAVTDLVDDEDFWEPLP
ncbi:MAG: hypothetical protein V4479_15830 [Actinomycetota bacterium]